MLNSSPATKVHLRLGVTDMRMGFEGLCALAAGPMELDPMSGHVFVFCNKSRTRVKLLYWDGSGLWVCAKRLERGRFSWPDAGPGATGKAVICHAELSMLLSGIDPRQTRKRAWLRTG
jgi:transposase